MGSGGRQMNPLNLLVGLADGLCAIEVAETPEAQGSYLDLATAADEMNQVCVDFSILPEGSIASNIGKASQLLVRYDEEQYAELLVGVDGKLTLTMRSYQPNVQCRRPIILSDQGSSNEILRKMPANVGNTVFGRRGLPGVRVILPLTFTSSKWGVSVGQKRLLMACTSGSNPQEKACCNGRRYDSTQRNGFLV